MIRTIDFNALAAGTIVTDEYDNIGVTVSATGGSGDAMTFDSANPTGDDTDLASDTLEGLLIVSTDGDTSDPDDHDGGGSIFFDFETPSWIKFITLKDFEEDGGGSALIFYDADGGIIDDLPVFPVEDGGEQTISIAVPGVSRLEVRLEGSGAVDNLVFDDGIISDDGPTAIDDEDTTDIDEAVIVDLRINDFDTEDATTDLVIVSATSSDGTVVNNDNGTVTFTPASGFEGEAIINYIVRDTDGNTDEGQAVITVGDGLGDDGPTAVDDVDDTPVDTAVTVDLRSNDTDPNDATSTLIISGATSPNGTIVDNGDGTVLFTPTAGFEGAAIIEYTVSDPDGNSDTGQAVVTVGDATPVDGDPTAAPDFATTPVDTAVPIDVRGNDFDGEDFPSELTISAPTTDDGTVAITGDGELTYTPSLGFEGVATLNYTLTDTDGNTDIGVVTVTVGDGNAAPTAVDDTATTPASTLLEDIDVLGNDTDPEDDPLRVVSATSPDGTATVNPDGTLNFLPTDGFTGPATITYVISDRPEGDPSAETATGTVVVTVPTDPGGRDGIVDGTDGDDLIDDDYVGDPDGDLVDALDEILPGAGPNDDVIRAGDGDDTVVAGEGDDSVTGGTGDDDINGNDGDDTIEGEGGNDTVNGGAGDDVINTGNGDLAPDLGYPTATTDPLGYDPDTDPENDRDLVIGGAGNDTITTGDDRDTIRGNTGDDVIDGGIDDDLIDGGLDDDRIVGGEGNDSILGGAGNDTIYAGNDPDLGLDILALPDEATDGFPFSPDRNPDNGQDTVDGGVGDDIIFGADDDDLLTGGAGDDYIDGEVDDDTIFGNDGDDTLIGGQGNDSIEGGENSDDIQGGDGDDTLRGDRDDDIIVGGDGDDDISGGADDDELFGGEGDDIIRGDLGDDDIQGGAGADTLLGGAGMDVFSDVNAGDVIDGGSGPVDMDTLDLRGSAPDGGRLEVTFTSADEEDGIVNYFNADDTDAGSLVFEEIETLIIPCFTPGTRIATPKGERLVEELQVGDRVITRDNGMQEIRWIGKREMSGEELQAAQHLRPVLIQAGALGNDLPERDMMVSPQHRVLIANDKTALYFEEREVLVAAKHLTDQEGIDVVDVSGTTYIHVMFDQHEVILSDGSWTESFQPGDLTLVGIGDAQREEILELFPELATQEGVEGYQAARRSLKKFEAKLVTK
jgi:Ca2+-binding RTX toxin-like protein